MKGTRLFNGKGKAGKQREHTFPSPYITSTELLYRKGIRDKFNFNGVKGALALILKRRNGNQEAVAKRRAIKPYCSEPDQNENGHPFSRPQHSYKEISSFNWNPGGTKCYIHMREVVCHVPEAEMRNLSATALKIYPSARGVMVSWCSLLWDAEKICLRRFPCDIL